MANDKFDALDVFTPKQIQYLLYKDKRLNILQGSVRSGKTYVSLIKWAYRVRTAPKHKKFLMVGYTSDTLVRNVLAVLLEQFGEANIDFSLSKKEASIFGHKVMLEYAHDEKASGKIRGITLDGAYCDEVSLYPESFFKMLMTRLSKRGATCTCTTNPDVPTHWLKTDYIDREDDLNEKCWFFHLDDNTFLDADYVASVKKEFTGVFYQRFIEGLWVLADGLVYSAFDKDKHWIKSYPLTFNHNSLRGSEWTDIIVGVDYGISNPTAFVMLAWHIPEKRWEVVRCYEYGTKMGEPAKTDAELYDDLVKFIGNDCPNYVYIDPSAESFAVLIDKKKQFRLRDADNSVNKGIGFTNTLFKQNKLFIWDSCTPMLRELYAYSWDSDASKKAGKDIVKKDNDHTMDALRYACTTFILPHAQRYGIYYDSANHR